MFAGRALRASLRSSGSPSRRGKRFLFRGPKKIVRGFFLTLGLTDTVGETRDG
jgi:hypothetical protein